MSIPTTYIRENRGHEISWSTYFMMLISSVVLFGSFIYSVSTADAAESQPSRITAEIRAEAKLFKMVPRLYLQCVDTLIGTGPSTQAKMQKRCQKVWDYQAQKIRKELARREAEAAAEKKRQEEAATQSKAEEETIKTNECLTYYFDMEWSRVRPNKYLFCSASYNYGKDFDGNWEFKK